MPFDALTQAELDLILALQSIPGLTGLMQALTYVGHENFFVRVMPIFYWCLDAALGARLLLAAGW